MSEQSQPGADTGSGIDPKSVWIVFHDRLFGFVRRRVASDQDAEDLVQDVFTKMQARAGQGDEVEDLSGWLFAVTRNAVADYHRARAKVQPVTGDADEQAAPTGDGREPGAELSRCLRPFVEQLPEPYAEALTLTDLGGMSQTEAAAQLGLSVSGMKSRVQRGRVKLREMVLDCCDVELDARRHVVDYTPRPRSCDDCSC